MKGHPAFSDGRWVTDEDGVIQTCEFCLEWLRRGGHDPAECLRTIQRHLERTALIHERWAGRLTAFRLREQRARGR